jgi:hypothetical protein
MKATVTAMRVFEYWLVWLINLVYNYGVAVGDLPWVGCFKVIS